MKFRLAVLTFLFVSFLTARNAKAIYDPRSVSSNKVGVHILNTDELSEAAKLVNSQNGDWGYVTIPIQPSDRDKTKWQAFMKSCRDLHLIPIIRITTIPLGGTWDRGHDTDLVDFANFLNELNWPIENRYIVLFNEVNRDQEWGGKVDPGAYARIVKNANSIFKERNRDFYLLGPALDNALPDSSTSLSAAKYLKAMQQEDNYIWTYFDGWAAHSYPNPAFSASPTKIGMQSIVSYKSDFSLLKLDPKPVFITETGWDQDLIKESTLTTYWSQAFKIWNQDRNVVAVTPFVLQGGNQFGKFSLMGEGNVYRPSGNAIRNLNKSAGSPVLSGAQPTPTPDGEKGLHLTSGDSIASFRPSTMTIRIENFFRSLFGLPKKAFLSVGTKDLTVEIAGNEEEWEKGLSGREKLDSDTGMLFQFPRKHIPIFWMKDMNFPIDIIWLNGNKIVSIEENVPVPDGNSLPTYSPKESVDRVLEVPAGYSKENGWEPGLEVNFYD